MNQTPWQLLQQMKPENIIEDINDQEIKDFLPQKQPILIKA